MGGPSVSDDETLTQAALEQVPDGFVALDADFRITDANAASARLLDLDHSDIVGASFWDVFLGAFQPPVRGAVERAAESGQFASFVRYNAAVDQWFEVRLYPEAEGISVLFSAVRGMQSTRQELEQTLEAVPVGILILDSDGVVLRANERAGTLLGYSHSALAGHSFEETEWDLWDEQGRPLTPEAHPVATVLQGGERVEGFTHGIALDDGSEKWLTCNVAPLLDGDTTRGVIVSLEDVTVLKRLERLIETLQPVRDVLNRASTRSVTEQEICDLLVASAQYDLAWIAPYTPGADQLDPTAFAGPESAYLADIEIPLTGSTGADGPSRVAVETATIQVIEDVQTADRFEPWQEAAAEYNFARSAAVPLVYGDRVYGVLGLYSGRTHSFDTRERQLLSTLGHHLGQVIHTLETERLLHAESVVELTFESEHPDSLLVAASRALDCTITVTGTVRTAETSLLSYLGFTGTTARDFQAFAEDSDAVASTRILSGGESAEFRTTEPTIPWVVLDAGAAITEYTVTDGVATITCELPAGSGVSALVARIVESFDRTELVAKHEYDRQSRAVNPTPISTLNTILEEQLTDRQQQVLRAAYHGGYFESPRRSTGSDIADALSMTQSTFAYHLRNAQKAIFDAMFEFSNS